MLTNNSIVTVFTLLLLATATTADSTVAPKSAANAEGVTKMPEYTSSMQPTVTVAVAIAEDPLNAENGTRTARMVKYLTDPKTIVARHSAKQQQQQLRQRADFGAPALPLGPVVPKRLPNAYVRPQPPPAFPPRPQVLRRAHNNAAPAPSRFGYEPLKSSYYSPLKLGQPPYGNGGNGGANAFGKGHNAAAQRPPFANPNALPQQSQQQHQQQQQHHFKASPPFNGQAIVRPAAEKQPAEAYPKQYALPQQQQQQQQQQAQPQQQALLQQQQPQVFPNSIGVYQQPPAAPLSNNRPPQQQQQQQPFQFAYQQQQQQQHAAGGQKMYSVYEEPEHMEHASLQLSSQQQYGAAALTSADMLAARQAQDYIKFMNSNDYFLPKRDPNYKQLDAEKDRQQQHAQQYQHHPQQQQQQHHHHPQQQPQQQQQQQYHHHQQQQQQQQHKQLRYGQTPASVAEPTFNQQPIQVPPLFFTQSESSGSGSGAPQQQQHSTPPGSSAAIVRGSYQTGNNMFVVNSDGNKAVHHIVASPLPTQQLYETTTPTAVTSQRGELRYSAAHRRTPEPQRFEFTENDAMPSAGSYASTPHTQYHVYNDNGNNNNNIKNKAMSTSTREPPASVISSSLPVAAKKKNAAKNQIYASRKSATEPSVLGSGTGTGGHVDDDLEDGDDMHVMMDNFSRKPPKLVSKKLLSSSSSTSTSTSSSSSSSTTTTTTTPAAPPEQKDTEEYCERMCAIVHDDNAEIVCGSDGYMYTSEAQMECYASCLHIDVTIQSKGSCNER